MKEDLAAVYLTSRRFHAIAEPLCYKHVVLRRVSRGNSTTALTRFLRSILSRPILANYVRSLDIAWEDVSMGIDPDPQNTSDTALVTAAARSVGVQCSLTSHGAHFGLLFYLLPSIQSLSLFHPANPTGVDKFLSQQKFLPTAALPAGLKTLREIVVWHNYALSPKSLLVLMMLPTVRTICVRDIGDTDEHDDTTAYAGRSSVTQLTLGYVSMPTLSLARILAVPRALARFVCIDRTRDPWRFDSAVFGQALRRFRSTLQYLRLTFRNGSRFGPPRDMVTETLGSLRDWPVLKNVWCPISVMLGQWPALTTVRLVDMLPAVIGDLRVGNYAFERWRYAQVMQQVMEVLEQKKVSGFDHLERVTMMMKWKNRETEERLKAACEAVGVVLVMTHSTDELLCFLSYNDTCMN